MENNLDTMGGSGLSGSNPSLNSRPSSMNISLATKEELIVIIQDLQSDLAALVRSYSGDKERLKNAISMQDDLTNQNSRNTLGLGGNMHQIAALKNSLNYATQQNSLLRAKLQKIHLDSQVDDLPPVRIFEIRISRQKFIFRNNLKKLKLKLKAK